MFSNSMLNLELFQIMNDVWFDSQNFAFGTFICSFSTTEVYIIILKTPSCHCSIFFLEQNFQNWKLPRANTKISSGRSAFKNLLGGFSNTRYSMLHSFWSPQGSSFLVVRPGYWELESGRDRSETSWRRILEHRAPQEVQKLWRTFCMWIDFTSGKGLILTEKMSRRPLPKCKSFGTGKPGEETDHKTLSIFVL